MRNCLKSVSLALALALLGVVGVRADDSTQTANPSLGQVAKQLKAQKAKESKPARVFTNDNLESNAPITISADKNNDAKPSTPPAATAQPESAPHNAEYYRAEMSKLKSHLDTNQRELDVLQQKLGQNQIQYYGDPNKSLQQQYSRDDVNKLTDDITAKKDEVASDNKAIDGLRDQLRHEGGDPGMAPISENIMVRLPLATLVFFVVASPPAAFSQQDPSLGAVARELRAEKKSEPKPSLVITNDNLPNPKPDEAISVLSTAPDTTSTATAKEEAKSQPSAPKDENRSSESSESKDDKVKAQDYWQARFRNARTDVAKAKEHEQLSDDELNLLQIREVRELDPASKSDLSTQVDAKQSEVNVNRDATDAAQKALDELTKEFEASGASEDWSKTD